MSFSKGNAGAFYAEFFNDARRLNDLNWEAIPQSYWRDPDGKEAKQAELLIAGSFPWESIEAIGHRRDERTRRSLQQKIREQVGYDANQPTSAQ